MIYGRKNDADTGSIKQRYLAHGKVAYEASIRARGLHHETAFEHLVWSEQRVWCEIARAISEIASDPSVAP
jgi:hypothetical protein